MSQSALASGLTGQFELRSDLISQGYRPIGWKAGFGAPVWQERFRIDGPLIGFLTDATLLDEGAEVDISGWPRPVPSPRLRPIWGPIFLPEAAPTGTRPRSQRSGLP